MIKRSIIASFQILPITEVAEAVLIFHLLLFASTISAQTIKIYDREYVFDGDAWYLITRNGDWQVYEYAITVIFRKDVSQNEIESFNKTTGVNIIRSNRLGHVDLQVPENYNPVELAVHYINSGLVEIALPGVYTKPLSEPNNPSFSSQWFHKQTQDHGTDYRHKDLGGNIWQNLGEDADDDGKVIQWNSGTEMWEFDPDDVPPNDNTDDDGNGLVNDLVGWDFFS